MKRNNLLKLGGILVLFSTLMGCLRVDRSGNAAPLPSREEKIQAAMGQLLEEKYGESFTVEQPERQKANMAFVGDTFTALVRSGNYPGTFTARVDAEGKILSQIVPGEYQRFEKEEWTFRISAVWCHFYRRSLWERYHIRFRSGERGEDMPVSLFFSAVCDKIATTSETGYYYVQHSSSAVHNFRGLKKYRLPYDALEDAILKIRETGISNSPEFCELFVLRILSTCFFQLAPGASRDKMKELCDYIIRILNMYYPEYYRNKKARLTAPLDIPFVQKAAVKILILLVRTGMIHPVSCLMSRKE